MKKTLDLNNWDHAMIVTGMTGLVEKGMHPREVMELMEDIKRQTFHALLEIYEKEGHNDAGRKR